nr:immunoglobulin light chain junction region [Macaca mulatta]
CQQERTWPWTF